MKYIFLADFFEEHVSGGAERNDSALLIYLQKNHEVEKVLCQHCTVDFVRRNKDARWIVGNRVTLNPVVKDRILSLCDYVIYEHDCQFVSNRDVSKFVGFKAPDDMVKDKLFYENARGVVALSEKHKQALLANIPDTSVVSIGTSLWNEEDFKTLREVEEKYRNLQREKAWAVIDWKNPVKGTVHSVLFCNKQKKEYHLLEKRGFREILEELAKHEVFVFHPQVFETFSRICAEAKMIGCKVGTFPNFIGFFGEQIANLSGAELIDALEKRVEKGCKVFEEVFEEEKKENQIKEDLTVILNVYRRPHLLQEQIDSMKSQTHCPKEIWVWVNDHEDNRDFDFSQLSPDIKVIRSNHNFKYLGRFALGMLVQTQFVAFFDDDTMPGNRWFENCFETFFERSDDHEHIILGGVGCRLKGGRYQGHKRIGWSNPNEQPEEVDLVGHAWFMEKEVLCNLWLEEPFTYETGEDMHLSYIVKNVLGGKTFVPPHPQNNQSLWSSTKGMEYGIDKVASSRPSEHVKFYSLRDEMVKHYKERGWGLCEDRGII